MGLLIVNGRTYNVKAACLDFMGIMYLVTNDLKTWELKNALMFEDEIIT
jgi:hypothetical protein